MAWLMSRSFRSDKTVFIQINRIEFLYSPIEFPKVLKINANIVDGEEQHVFHNVTRNMQETWEYSQLGDDDHRWGTIEDECEEC